MSLICFSTVLALLFLLRLFKTEQFLEWYNRYTNTLVEFELWLENRGANTISVALILFNYVLKAVMPWFPVSCICVASAVLFKWYQALLINLVGLAILFALKFYWGRARGPGNAGKLVERYDWMSKAIEEKEISSGVILFFARLLPSVPINSVSCLYGATEMPIGKFLLISETGFLFKAISYIIIGRNVFDPASANFVGPFIPLIFFSGLVFLGLGGAFENLNKRVNKNLKIKKG